MRRLVGLDLGQQHDATALAILERPRLVPRAPLPSYALRHLDRYPLGTPYPEIVDGVLSLLRQPALTGSTLVVDRTGVGRAVVDLLRDRLRGRVRCQFCPITITAGHAITVPEEGGLHVPKKELVGTLQILLQTRRLHVANSLALAPLLKQELSNFRVKITAARNEVFEAWRQGQNDDLVLALALAAFVGERAIPVDSSPVRILI